jgi:exopolysaccharide biosynthesis polyprenyl glycosylphosphotransferase
VLKRYSTNLAIFCAFLDGLMVVISMHIANIIRPELTPVFDFVKNIRNPQPINELVFIGIAVIWIAVYVKIDLYDPKKNFKIVDEIYNLMIGSIIALVLISGFFYLINSQLSRLLFLIFGMISFGLHLTHRIIYRWVCKKFNHTNNHRHRLLIAGAGSIGRRFEQEIKKYTYLGYDLQGFIDDDPELIRENPDVFGDLNQVNDLVATYDIDELIIALPKWANERVSQLVEKVHKLPVRVWVIPDYFSLMLIKSAVSDFGDIPMINLRAPALTQKQRITKRIIDLFVAIPLFIMALPLFLMIGTMIKLDSKGSIFYHSSRVKEGGKPFIMVKFRTMGQNAHTDLAKVIKNDEEGNLIHKLPDDPRVTKIGKFLRKTSMDELPQLINIIKGDMSLIGPRPELPEMVKFYQPWQYKRFAAPQGLTGWWQINGRGDKPMHLHTEDDLYYIKNYSIWLDLQILIKTVLIVLRGKGAY